MNGYWIGPLFTLLCALAFIGYWYRRFDREHRERMAQIEIAAAAEHQRFEADKKVWDEKQAKAKAEHAARIAQIGRAAGAETAALSPGDRTPPLVQRILEYVATECRPATHDWEARLSAQLSAELLAPFAAGELIDDTVLNALFARIAELERALSFVKAAGHLPADVGDESNHPK
jgi:hypothetical protein